MDLVRRIGRHLMAIKCWHRNSLMVGMRSLLVSPLQWPFSYPFCCQYYSELHYSSSCQTLEEQSSNSPTNCWTYPAFADLASFDPFGLPANKLLPRLVVLPQLLLELISFPPLSWLEQRLLAFSLAVQTFCSVHFFQLSKCASTSNPWVHLLLFKPAPTLAVLQNLTLWKAHSTYRHHF